MKIKKLSEFTFPLKALKNNINSVVFNKNEKNLIVNAKSQDVSQIVNLKWSTTDVEISDTFEPIGIYNLSEFLTTIEMFNDTEIEATVDKNKLNLKYKNYPNIDVKYNLSDLTLIQEGPEKPKSKIDWLIQFKADTNFLKKVKTIGQSLNINTLKFECKDSEFSFSVSDRYFHSHLVKESVFKKDDIKDFEVFINIDRLNIIPEGKDIQISINEKVTEFNIEELNKYKYRYFIAPLIKE